jgi:MFS family permease
MTYSLTGIFPYSIPFLVKVPALLWRQNKNDSWEDWDQDEACDGSYFDYKVNHSSHETVTNWVTSMNLIWAEDYKVGLFGTLYFLGFFIGSAFLLRYADLKGRRKLVMIGILGSVIWSFLIFVIENIIITYLLMFVMGVFVSLRMLLSFIYALELVPSKNKKLWNLIAAFVDGLVMIILAGWFYLILYGESTIVIYIIFSLVSLYYVYKAPESPQYLYSRKKWAELHKAFERISQINHITWQGFKFDKEHIQVNEFNIKQSWTSMIKDKKTFRNLTIMMINWSTCSFTFYLLSYYTKYFEGNIYSNTVILGIADILGTMCMRGLQYYFQTGVGFIISFLLVFFVSLLYYTIMSHVFVVACWVFMMRFGITVSFGLAYYGNGEYFQTDIASTAFGACNTMARFSTIISPMVAEVLTQPIILITCWTFIAAVVSFFLVKPMNVLDSIADAQEQKESNIDDFPDLVRDHCGEHDSNKMPKEEQKTEGDVDESFKDPNDKEFEGKKIAKDKFMIMDYAEGEVDENDLDQL